MVYSGLKLIFNKRFLFSIILHVLHGFIFEKSKLYYPYTFDRNILLMKTDLYKFYLSTCFIFLSLPFLLSKLSPKKYFTARTTIENRYQSRNSTDIQIGGHLLAISMILTGFCPSYLPVYLAINPLLFLYCIAASYTAYMFYHSFGTLLFNRINLSPINNDTNNYSSISNEKDTLNNIGRFVIISVCILLVLIFETSEQSISKGHSSDEMFDLIYHGDYLPPGLTGILCGFINFFLIFFCYEYQTLTSEWLINLFYYGFYFTTGKRNLTGQLCVEQILKVLAMAFGVRLSLLTSKRQEIPNIDWLFYSLASFGSFFGALSICFTTATFSDHIYLINAFMGSVSSEAISLTIGAAWILLYLIKLLGLSNLK
ncbi:unnamed protein product [Rotaria magnacalcarata]|uniref:Uncharacterized protein n=1 Tax=Rotaria magnacalcarata TaxID=392030 RepID=A0A816Q3U6_9BILA|nr:unnamed protein product [Rotaria magnacalcarata]CAF2055939.1 unnamed protein product [Rotaria magnacalcarata]CAF2065265.1 unnamed protein product [Rotaria magnacalcarata]